MMLIAERIETIIAKNNPMVCNQGFNMDGVQPPRKANIGVATPINVLPGKLS